MLVEKLHGRGQGVGARQLVERLQGLLVLLVCERRKNHALFAALVFHLDAERGGERFRLFAILESSALPFAGLAQDQATVFRSTSGWLRTIPTGQWSEPSTCGRMNASVTWIMNGVETPK